jgi:hypothetical protein
MPEAIDIKGETFGRWKVLGFKGDLTKFGERKWLCRCSCNGGQHLVISSNLRRGISKSCGCLRAEQITKWTKENQSRIITYRGKTKTVKEWGEVFEIKGDTIRKRISRGWGDIKSITTPL